MISGLQSSAIKDALNAHVPGRSISIIHSVYNLISSERAACKDEWFDAIKKEHEGLDNGGVLKYETMPEACKNGHISAKKKPIDIRLLLSTKIKPDGSFDKRKARAFVSGDQMVQGVHYSAVFTPTPSLTAGKILRFRIRPTVPAIDPRCRGPNPGLNHEAPEFIPPVALSTQPRPISPDFAIFRWTGC